MKKFVKIFATFGVIAGIIGSVFAFVKRNK